MGSRGQKKNHKKMAGEGQCMSMYAMCLCPHSGQKGNKKAAHIRNADKCDVFLSFLSSVFFLYVAVVVFSFASRYFVVIAEWYAGGRDTQTHKSSNNTEKNMIHHTENSCKQ